MLEFRPKPATSTRIQPSEGSTSLVETWDQSVTQEESLLELW